jgi:hypothetical protein
VTRPHTPAEPTPATGTQAKKAARPDAELASARDAAASDPAAKRASVGERPLTRWRFERCQPISSKAPRMNGEAPASGPTEHYLSALYKGLLAAQHRAEIAGLNALAISLRADRAAVWRRICGR